MGKVAKKGGKMSGTAKEFLELVDAGDEIATFGRGLGYVRDAGRSWVGTFAVDIAKHQLSHLATGVLFLFTLGAIGSSFGDAGFFAELALQGVLMAQIIGGLLSRNLVNRGNIEAVKAAANEAKGLGFLQRITKSWSAYSKRDVGGVYRTQMVFKALSLAAFSLQAATVLLSGHGSA